MNSHNFEVAILCGGQSSRMGQPKHDMPLPDKRPLVSHMIDRIRSARPEMPTIHISLRAEDQSFQTAADDRIQFIYDSDDRPAGRVDLGPASGLLAAHHRDPTAHWLVIACDYPLLCVDDLRYIIESYEPPLTCFENVEGWPEPLLAIWSPLALQALERNVQAGMTGPIKTLKALQTKRLKPLDERSLLNANTPADWEAALRIFRQNI
ncbi:hypothetical protein PRZ48_013755 [Zasmidium cellare]|uniref:MobA-like NTP transferase domain-containing protein n=1 Tax=Zasmidium cellare TaxID=395010 RepID=A0ABR0E1Y1_ZASCE|nr:hypothetical protein PRZ48_013755 [Zasmidium cellare]